MMTSELLNDIKLSPISSILAIAITALGMVSSFLVLLLYLTDNNIEKHNNNYSQTYRIETQFNLPSGDEIKSAQVPLPLLSALQAGPVGTKLQNATFYKASCFEDLRRKKGSQEDPFLDK